MPDNLLSAISNDLGIPRMIDENDLQFSCRASYSALRFWIQAFCLDDGYGGSYGVSSSAIIRKSTFWLRNLSDLYPGLLDWYHGNEGIRRHLHRVLQVLADVQDLVITEDGLYRCTALHEVQEAGLPLLLGLTDPTNHQNALPLSGMAYISTESSHLRSGPIYNDDVARLIATKEIFCSTEDDNYIMIDLALPLPKNHHPLFDLLTWPVSSADDQQHRLLRSEYASRFIDLLRLDSQSIP